MQTSADLTALIQVLSGSPAETLSPDQRHELLLIGIVATLERDASPNAAAALLATAVHQALSGARDSALLALRRLAEKDHAPAIDAVYTLAVEQDLLAARQWIETRDWQPTRPTLRALFDWFSAGSRFSTLEELHLLARAFDEEASPALRARMLSGAPAKGMENWALIVSATLPTAAPPEIERLVKRYPAFNETERHLALDRLTALAHAAATPMGTVRDPPSAAGSLTAAAAQAIPLLFVEYEDPSARQVALQNGFHPQDPHQQALFLFLAEDWPAYSALDFDHSLLVSAYETGSRALKRRLLEHARRTGQMDWLRDLSASGEVRWPADLTDADWEMAIQRLTHEAKHPELWRLALVAPPVWTVQILERLASAGWLPSEAEERPFFAALTSLARECRAAPLALYPRKTLIAPHGALNCLAIRPDGGQVAAGSSEQPIYTWSMPEGRLRYPPLSGPAPVVRALAFSPDGSLLAAAAGDHRIRIFRMQDGALVKTLDGHRALIRALAMHPDGRLLASAGFDGSIRLWRFPHGAALKTIQPPSDGPVAEIFALVTGATSGGAAYLLSAGADRRVSVWSLPDGVLLRQMSGHEDTITNLSTSPASDLVASAGRDGVVRVWNYTSGGLVRALEDAGAPLTALCLHPTDQVLLGAISQAQGGGRSAALIEILVWNLSTGRIIARYPGDGAAAQAGQTGHLQPVTGLAVSPAGDDLYSCDTSGRLLTWDLRTFLTVRLASESGRPGAAAQLLGRLKNASLSATEGKWLAFSAELARYRHRFDIELAEFKTIPVGEFDIEI